MWEIEFSYMAGLLGLLLMWYSHYAIANLRTRRRHPGVVVYLVLLYVAGLLLLTKLGMALWLGRL